MPPLDDTPIQSHSSSRLWLGVAVIIIGILAALDNLNVFPGGFFLRFWPVVLIIFGIAKLSRAREDRGISGWIFILGGTAALIANLRASLFELIWPLFIVLLGVFLVTRALRKNRGVPPELAALDSFVSSAAIFSGTKRRITHQDFKGGELTAIFGGFELDLRQAILEAEQVRVDVFVLFGGGEIKVPQNWTVTMKGSAIMGGFEDKTLHVPAAEGGPRVHLVITGLVLMGGLTVSN